MSEVRRKLLIRINNSEYEGLKFKSNGSTTVSLSNTGNNAPDIKYSLNNGRTWILWDYSSIFLNNGLEICFKGNNSAGISSSSSKYSKFTFSGTGTIEASGNIMSLIDDGVCLTLTIPCNYCFFKLFYQCTLLITAPELPATTLTEYCYGSIFYGCALLTTAPELPATTLADRCYVYMFLLCSNLTTAPSILPAEILRLLCYYAMFKECISLTTAPVLAAMEFSAGCCTNMFNGCSNLNYIKCLSNTGSKNSSLTLNWVKNVSSIGTFAKPSIAVWESGVNGIPVGWTIISSLVEVQYNPTETFTPSGYITCTARENNTLIGLYRKSTNQTMYISKDAQHWMIMQVAHAIELNNNEVVYICGNLTGNNTPTNYTQFAMIGKVAISGNCNSLWNYNDLNAALKEYCGYKLFNYCDITSAPELLATTLTDRCYAYMFLGCSSLTSAPELPATTLASHCYYYMFFDCSNLTSAPVLPATTLANYCYDSMFYGCTSLTSAPALPAMALALTCYRSMFLNCTSLTTAPELPATTLANYCYSSMFYGCSSLTSAPELPAETLTSLCYFYLFYRCTNLSYIKCLATTGINSSLSTYRWVNQVSPSGTFVKSSSASWPTDVNGIPSGWTVQNI